MAVGPAVADDGAVGSDASRGRKKGGTPKPAPGGKRNTVAGGRESRASTSASKKARGTMRRATRKVTMMAGMAKKDGDAGGDDDEAAKKKKKASAEAGADARRTAQGRRVGRGLVRPAAQAGRLGQRWQRWPRNEPGRRATLFGSTLYSTKRDHLASNGFYAHRTTHCLGDPGDPIPPEWLMIRPSRYEEIIMRATVEENWLLEMMVERQLKSLCRNRGALTIFHRFDEDGSGELDGSEFRSMLKWLLGVLDKDGGGSVDFAEFAKFVGRPDRVGVSCTYEDHKLHLLDPGNSRLIADQFTEKISLDEYDSFLGTIISKLYPPPAEEASLDEAAGAETAAEIAEREAQEEEDRRAEEAAEEERCATRSWSASPRRSARCTGARRRSRRCTAFLGQRKLKMKRLEAELLRRSLPTCDLTELDLMIDEDAILHPATFLPAFSFPMIRDPTPEVSDAESEVAEVEEEEAAAEVEEEVAAEAEATGPSEADVARMKQRLEGMRLKRAMKRVSTVIFKNLILPSRMRGDGEQRGAYSGPRVAVHGRRLVRRVQRHGLRPEDETMPVKPRQLPCVNCRGVVACACETDKFRAHHKVVLERRRRASFDDGPSASRPAGQEKGPTRAGITAGIAELVEDRAALEHYHSRNNEATQQFASRLRSLESKDPSTHDAVQEQRRVKDCGFIEAVLMGLAPDKGLLVPHSIPEVSAATLEQWKKLSFPELSTEIISLYIDPKEISKAELAELTRKAYSTFRTDEVTPVAPLGGDYKLLELFHGPTYAFKGVALHSAIEGIRGKKGVDCFILYPNNRTSKIQEAQMCSVPARTATPSLEDAFFDDCQKIVKTLFADQAFHKKHSLGAVNSINWARIVAQIVYYFYAQLKFDEPCHFSVPTGNFGDVLAGWYAKQMGCPCKSLVVATNANDILARFFATGTYSKPPSVVETVTPSMDISVSSNFERFVYHCCGDDDKILKGLMDTFEATGAFTASPEHWEKCKAEMYAGSCQQPQILATIKKWHEKTDYVLDPHTAVGVYCAEQLKATLGPGPVVCLACAHHGKFPTSIEKAIGAATLAEVPEEKNLTDLLDLPKRKNVLVNSLGRRRLRRGQAPESDFGESENPGRRTAGRVTTLSDGGAAAAFRGTRTSTNLPTASTPSNLFDGAAAFDAPIGDWDVSAVTSMRNTFAFAAAFDASIGGWDVSKVTDMRDLFYGASTFNADIDAWRVSSVTDMDGIFDGASAFDQCLRWHEDFDAPPHCELSFANKAELKAAVGEWIDDSTTAEAKYGPIEGWDVSEFTDLWFAACSSDTAKKEAGGGSIAIIIPVVVAAVLLVAAVLYLARKRRVARLQPHRQSSVPTIGGEVEA
ncbi:hypothetical protein JL722_9894 [Aureococcus anophagefferens]|nr:hypothetical protein JL722_9894 [Aureococcus anophagefferens]